MTHHTKKLLPPGMALIETADGRWFAALAPLTETAPLVTVLETGARTIPPARDAAPCRPSRPGYGSRKKALEACRAWDEEVHLPGQWSALAAHSELYPERNAWYLEEMAQMTGESPLLFADTMEAVAAVIVPLRPGFKLIEASGVCRDEAIERLYQRVDAWWNGLVDTLAS